MTKIILPVGRPPVMSYLHHAFPLAILEGLGWKSSGDWLFNHYVQVDSAQTIQGHADTEIDFHLTPTHFFHYANSLHILNIKRDLFLGSATGIHKAVADLLQVGYYLQITLDERLVPGTYAFGKHSFLHESLVHGIDFENNTAWILGFDAEMSFRSREIPLENLVQAIVECDLTNHYDPDGLKLVRAREQRPTRRSTRTVALGMEDYILSRNSDLRTPELIIPTPNQIHGLQVQAAVALFCEERAASQAFFDIRPLHLLWEHKRLMLERLQWFRDHGIQEKGIEEYQAIERDANTARLLGLKYQLSKAPGLLGRIATLLRGLTAREEEILTRWHQALISSEGYSL